MPVNFNLLRQAGPANFAEGLMQGQEEQRLNAMTQQKMAQEQEMNALRRQQVTGQIQAQEDVRRKQNVAEKTGMFRERLLRAPNAAAARELVKMQYADPDIGAVLSQGGTLDQALAEVPDDPTQFERYRAQEAMGMAEWLKSQLPKTVGNAIYLPGENRFVTPPQREQAAPAGAPIAVMQNGRPVYVSREEAIGQTPFTPTAVKMMDGGAGTRAATPAAPAAPAGKPMTQLQQQAQRKLMAADRTSVKNSQNVVGELEKLTDELVGNPEKGIRPDPGLSGITGFQALIPSMPKSDARKAQQKLETMKGKVMAFGRQLASLEGKLGNMAVQEWKFVSDSIQALDPAAGNLDVQLRDIVRQAKNFANTVQERYDLTYEGGEEMPSAAPSRPSAPAPAAGAGGGLSPAEQAELDQLRARFGKSKP
jgi:hypothetical protein